MILVLAHFRFEEAVGIQSVLDSNHIRAALGGIFDSASYGQFLFGTDGRNDRFGFRIAGHVNVEHFAQPRASRISGIQGWPVKVSQGLQLLSVHVHSKDPRIFRANSPESLVTRPIGQQRRRIDGWALRSNIAAATERRIRNMISRRA